MIAVGLAESREEDSPELLFAGITGQVLDLVLISVSQQPVSDNITGDGHTLRLYLQ